MKRIANLLALSGAGVALIALVSARIMQTYWKWEIDNWVINSRTDALLVLALVLVLSGALLGVLSKGLLLRRRVIIVALSLGVVVVAFNVVNTGINLRLPIQQKGNYFFTQDWVTSNVEVWNHSLAELKGKSHLRALEIGSFEGRSAVWFLENILTDSTSSITCIDVFDGPYERTFDNNLRSFDNKVTKIKAPSQQALRGLEFNHYDLVYIDGSHVAKDVLLDATLTWDLVKPGGLIIFDDYGWAGFVEQHHGLASLPRIAIDAFLYVFEPYIDVVHKGYQVIVRKRTRVNRESPQIAEQNQTGPS